MKLKFIAASVLAFAALSANAANQSFTIAPGVTFDFNGLALPGDGLLSGGSDVITFGGLATGAYEAVLSYSGNYVDITSASLNGMTPNALIAGTKTSLGSFDIIGLSPFTLTLNGIAGASPLAAYSGHITVSAVPEPSGYVLLMLGLGVLGLTISRKAPKQKFE
ncbi:FxDxF family PEP-CTERM protein [Duganella sp. FT3S]|uniref:FxDxF family PEP-CTERM protein n=1 Tax=Rugamonas fusca TaxID=2758568 RepID=A0A7W2EJP2_9BURK|nr:FxDxF family PEP-CTERM protein [Rugamonas fusca]MBA5607179.1 FxDxF family PEP-CTERM protein [Rugamonas fusca]